MLQKLDKPFVVKVDKSEYSNKYSFPLYHLDGAGLAAFFVFIVCDWKDGWVVSFFNHFNSQFCNTRIHGE